uniref:Dimethylglycine dehydrogenase n=1 Tax=Parascaris univalens TaxID=6257 RepID=A0A915CH97_PARUN
MQDITGRPISSSNFPSFRFKELSVGIATGIRAISVSHCGELGWVLYIPNEVAQNVYELIVDAGHEYGLMHAGYYALRQLRIEKFYVYWQQDINATVTPNECGRSFRVSFEKDFLGKEALVKQNEMGISKRFVQLLVDRHDMETDPWPQGGEVIYRDGKPAGRTTSAAYGFTLGCQVCIGYIRNEQFGVTPEYINKGEYEIDIAGNRFPVRLNQHSPTLPMISSELPTHYLPTQ